jgi:hypothetical protein
MKQNPGVMISRLLKIERLSRSLAELIAEETAKQTGGADTRKARMGATWNEIRQHVEAVERQVRLGQGAAAPFAGGN